MNTFTNYIKIRVGMCYLTGSPDERFTEAFCNMVYTTEEDIRSSIILQLNEAIGLHNWAIQFVQLTEHSKNYFTDIWADRREDYATIFYIMRDLLKDYNLTPFYQGTVSDLLRRERIHYV